MVATLRIRNLALVVDLTLDLEPGLNVITGETGAGKSILIGALGLVLGERADRHLIRHGAESCSVEAVFDVAPLRNHLDPLLEEHGLEPCEDNHLVLKRVLGASGSNRQFVNGSPTTLNVLARVGQWLVDIHGPHDHQSLLHAPRQLDILDAFGDLSKPREVFAVLARRRQDLVSRKSDLIVDEQTYARQLDLLRFQSREIQNARLDVGEEETLQQEFQRAANASRILELGQAAIGLLSGHDESILQQTGQLGRTLQELRRLDDGAAMLTELQEQAMASLQELPGALNQYLDRIDIDADRAQAMEERLNLIQSLKRKYGRTVPDVIRFGEDAAAKLAGLESRDAELDRLNAEIEKLDDAIVEAGRGLTSQRRKVIPKLARAVSEQLVSLGFKQCHFDVALESTDDRAGHSSPIPLSGFDSVEFQFAPNPGEPPRPLRSIASSGEMARVMLALKTVLAAEDSIPVLVFDEVDANVGGEVATVVGQKMRRIAEHRQVFCVTHLAQVAACGQAHYHVSKKVKAGRTVSEIERLDAPARIDELARMLGGKSEAARTLAEVLLQ